MAQTRNLNNSPLDDIFRRLYALEHASPLNNAAIGRSGLLVYDGGVITIENGGLDVTGIATVSGTLNVTGDTRLTGTTDIWGPLIVTGDTDLDGVTTITGDTTVTGNFEVNGSGRIKVGSMTLDPNIQGGALSFENGAQVFTDASTIQVFKGTSVVQIEDGVAKLQGDGSNYLSVDSSGTRVYGGLSIASAPTSSEPANVYMDENGKLFRSIA